MLQITPSPSRPLPPPLFLPRAPAIHPTAQRLLLTLLPALVLGTVAVSTIWGENGLLARHRLRAQLAAENAQLASIERDSQRLLRELSLMERDPTVLERMVADELEWGHDDAVIYRFEGEEPGSK